MRRGYILLITLILLTALSFIVGSLLYLTSAGIKNAGYITNREKAFYIAEAGLQKAVWYLMTPTGQGGKGLSWRTSGTTESFGGGSYTIKVGNAGIADQIIVTSEGDFRGTTRILQARYENYPPAFDYAIFSKQYVKIDGNTPVVGDMFANNNVVIDAGAAVTNGKVYVTPGYTVSGGGTYTAGTPALPYPVFPALDTSYYNTEITAALSNPTGNYDFDGTLNLAGGTIYVNNDITLRGTIIGPGNLVAGDDITVRSGTTIGDNIKFICQDYLLINSNATFGENNILYANNKIEFAANVTPTLVTGKVSILTLKEVVIGSNDIVNGIIHAGKIVLESNASFSGSIQGGNYGSENRFKTNTQVTFDSSKIPSLPPIGLEGGFSFVKDSWREL